MSETLTKTIVNCDTNTIEVLPLTAEEIAQIETDRVQADADRVAREAEEAAKAEAKASAETKLAALGLTTEEIAALSK